MNNNLDLNIDFDFNDNLAPQVDLSLDQKASKPKARSFNKISKHIYKRAYSEIQIFDILGINNLKDGYSYHCITGGDIDSLSYLKYILRQQNLKYLLFSTWCMAMEDIKEIEQWIIDGKIGRIDAYMGEIFPGSYTPQYERLCEIIKKNSGRVCITKNHSKIFAGYGDKYAFAVESSANINTNPRIENSSIIVGQDIYNFYKDFFDCLKSFNKNFPEWIPYKQ